ncbi:hypothetical protein HELRODRAFT_172651 [Helobdella robusta]|uniref:Uncharacterized protein n=1 Tax=Helobdella robusta TaxID=6412 RepID=T1F5Q4_HELRO|nr:hypothetical protein HELRODRAFT_172651 [Helobdella robusta]ESO04294.1 hypothetical protein HELRODRAFT_172651 [Helobdella robusta]
MSLGVVSQRLKQKDIAGQKKILLADMVAGAIDLYQTQELPQSIPLAPVPTSLVSFVFFLLWLSYSIEFPSVANRFRFGQATRSTRRYFVVVFLLTPLWNRLLRCLQAQPPALRMSSVDRRVFLPSPLFLCAFWVHLYIHVGQTLAPVLSAFRSSPPSPQMEGTACGMHQMIYIFWPVVGDKKLVCMFGNVKEHRSNPHAETNYYVLIPISIVNISNKAIFTNKQCV